MVSGAGSWMDAEPRGAAGMRGRGGMTVSIMPSLRVAEYMQPTFRSPVQVLESSP